jgi:hypothetical protein
LGAAVEPQFLALHVLPEPCSVVALNRPETPSKGKHATASDGMTRVGVAGAAGTWTRSTYWRPDTTKAAISYMGFLALASVKLWMPAFVNRA